MATINQLCNTGIMLEKGYLKSQDVIHKVMDCYERSIYLCADRKLPPGVIYEKLHESDSEMIWIRKVEILDENRTPRRFLSTWDYVIFRVHYVAKMFVKRGSGVLSISTLENTKLLLCSTMPDRNILMEIHEGEHYYECIFDKWPLAAGQYLLQAGLAIPMKEWLYQTKEPIPLTIESKDVYNSGMPPESSRYLFAAQYQIYPEGNY
jgi:lipopolysaccharide transport system ATP-binding protein